MLDRQIHVLDDLFLARHNVQQTTLSFSSYLKIAEGCDNRCSYCAIPYIRGRFRSVPMDELIEEAKRL